ncbi:MAG TPA: MFS transporter [Anaerolineales bacterium]|nr:MFS transporter [Anaerolineales bacterium]
MLTTLFRQTTIPREYRSNFLHLYLDIGWYGILNGSSISFLSIYATRLGATNFQIGLLGGIAAAVNLVLAIPAGRWLDASRQHTGRAVFWSALLYRICYIPFIFLPYFFDEQAQVVAILAITFLMAIPLTPIGVGFNALFAEAVPIEYRAHVAGIRNIMLSISFMLTSLVSGYILDHVAFPTGYQIVFALGMLGAGMSTLHIYFIKPLQTDVSPLPPQPRQEPGTKALSPRNLFASLRMDIWKTPFRSVLLSMFAFHFTQYLAVPIFPIFNVRALHLTDDNIGIGTALFYLTVLLGSTQMRKLAQSFGNKNVTGWSVAGLGFYPVLLAISRNAVHFYGVSLLGGLIFAFVSGAYANYMLECIPAHDRPSHLAWYTIVLNTSILIGSLGGPVVADIIGLSAALIVFAVLRFLAGIFILKWG